MIGQALSLEGRKYNIIVLAAGKGSRMGEQSEYIPKALSKIGNKRAIDYIMEKYLPVADRFIITTGFQADLLESYVKGRFSFPEIYFSRIPEDEITQDNGQSLVYALDHANSRVGTIVLFCDLLVVSNNMIKCDTILVATKDTKGKVGSFRHHDPDGNGILGNFVFSDTCLLKSIVYTNKYEDHMNDVTEDAVIEYKDTRGMRFEPCDTVYEFGTENDLKEVRTLWENVKY